jgi:flagellar hook-length control protein FliK
VDQSNVAPNEASSSGKESVQTTAPAAISNTAASSSAAVQSLQGDGASKDAIDDSARKPQPPLTAHSPAGTNLTSVTMTPAVTQHLQNVPGTPANNVSDAKLKGTPDPQFTVRSPLRSADEIASYSAASPVHMARMLSRAAQSEMRIGMSTSAFGNVEVRTVVHANEVGVVIGSERGDLPSLFTNELPGITHNLQHHDLQLNHVNFQQQGFSSGSNSQSGENSQTRSFIRPAILTRGSILEPSTPEGSVAFETPSRSVANISILA